MAAPKIINWEEAMNQVGGDKDFLDEVLADLLTESQTAQEEIGSLPTPMNDSMLLQVS